MDGIIRTLLFASRRLIGEYELELNLDLKLN